MPFAAYGWTILFYADFRLQWEVLTDRVIQLKSRLVPEDFVRHADVKLLKAIDPRLGDRLK